jgi:predicted Zn-dependent protease
LSGAAPTIEELREKVRADPGSRYFLGLAEALLRAGEREEALRVLEAGLAARPGQVAATVAKAKCLLELGRPGDAWGALEPLLERDPAHLVAAKLAVEAFVALGDARRARECLARYAALNAADPDLDGLEGRVARLEREAAAEDGELVTVTLGRLYLAQGHRAEAERIFRRVLRADPENAAAREALLGLGAAGQRGRT